MADKFNKISFAFPSGGAADRKHRNRFRPDLPPHPERFHIDSEALRFRSRSKSSGILQKVGATKRVYKAALKATTQNYGNNAAFNSVSF